MANLGIINSIRQAMDPLDPHLVDNTPRLLETLNSHKADKLQKLLVRKDGRGYTLLHLAVERNQSESLKCLLIKEANPNSVSLAVTNEVTPLHVAASLGHLACLQLLVQSGGDVLAMDKDQKTPLDYARAGRQDMCLNYLHEELGRRQNVETREMEEVLTAVERNLDEDNIDSLCHWQLFNDLFPLSLSAGSNISPLESILYRHCDVSNNHELVKVFGRLSRDIPVRIHNASLLHCAARYGRLELVRLLTKRIPQIALSMSSEGYNSLHMAVTHRQTNVARLLVDKQVEWVRRTRRLPSSEVNGSHHGTHNGSLGAIERSGVESSLSHGAARFATPTMSGHTVLHFAVAVDNRDSLSYLLKYHRELQLNVDGHECGYTALHLAVFLSRSEAVRLLLKKGANPNYRLEQATADGLSICRTPMAEAVSHQNLEIVGTLLEAGADDRQHDAIKQCEPYNRHQDLIVPLLASLVRQDDTFKPPRGVAMTSYHRKQKHAMLSWENISLVELPADWIISSLPRAPLLQSIDQRRLLDCVTYVNLSKNKLRTVPKELFCFTQMVHLNLMDNLLEYLPELHMVMNDTGSYIWPCHALSKLYLSKNSLQGLPEFLFQLPSLVFLELSQNQLKELPFDLWKAPRLHTLLCSNNHLESIPTNWPHVLSSCNVVQQDTPQHKGAEGQDSKRSTKGSDTGEDSTSPSSPYQTKSSAPEDRETVEATPLISKLHDRLNISNSNLPVTWEGGEGKDEDYEGLAILNLSHNAITEIPENLPCLCPKLIRLDLSHNQLTTICMPRCFPSDLKQMNLSNNKFTTIDCSNTVAKPLPCTNPQVLEEANNVLVVDNVSFCMHRNHSQLLRLMVLEITNCELDVVNFCKFGVRIKQSSSSDPTKRPQPPPKPQPRDRKPEESPVVCPILTRLILNNNQLMTVPMSVCEMKGLNSLDLSHNEIIHLPAEMGNLSNLWEFPLAGLKLISPPQNIIERGKTKDIIGFLWSLLQRARPYHRMKLMLVGYANRGKTTLLEKLSEKGQTGVKDSWGNSRMQRSGKVMSTVGIVVSDWTYFKPVKESQTGLKSITFMTWDFGGQEEYYATHQCFLSRRSLYLAVWNVTHGMDGAKELKPWLLNIQARAPNSPVIIVGTHYDKLSGRASRRELDRSLAYIRDQYGHVDNVKKDGFPQIMTSIVVSCTKGENINRLRDTLFDVASQVRENLVAGRGIGAGRIPEYRLLMDQLVPASYLQLEDTIRNTAMKMKFQGTPPVLTYKELRKEVFSDPNTLISKDSVNRELEQAVRFLHDNGTMLHFEDPMLQDFYFVDPQWLCDVMAHIVTVREINPFIKDGIMLTKDFAHIFKEDNHRFKFPLRWKAEYIRLLTTFEVAVELSDDQLLVPSALPSVLPVLHEVALPDEVKSLPALRHCYVVPFIPSGFWPRLMSRVFTDPSFVELAAEGCSLTDDEHDQLSWVKWRTGLILQYGNLSLLTVYELDQRGIFRYDKTGTGSSADNIHILRENRWTKNDRERVYGVSIEAHDIYPILKYPEIRRRYRKIGRGKTGTVRVNEQNQNHSLDRQVDVLENGELPAGSVGGRAGNLKMEQIDLEFAKLLKVRQDVGRPVSGSSLDGGSGRISPSPLGRPPRPSDQSPDLPTAKPHTLSSSSNLPVPSAQLPTPDNPPPPPSTSEAKNDKMRAGLLSKVIDHIILLMEDLYMGVRNKHLVVPCPHCVCNATPPTRMVRSFSDMLNLLPDGERREREELQGLERGVAGREEEEGTTVGGADTVLSFSEIGRTDKHPQDSVQLPASEVRACKFGFSYNDCVVSARTLNTMFCPRHGEIDLQYLAPDTLFLSHGREIAMETKDFRIMESVGRGAFATVYSAVYKDGKEVAVKAMTKEWLAKKEGDDGGDRGQEEAGLADQARAQQAHRVHMREPARRSIVSGFENVKKELAILSPLCHPHVVKLYGVILRPIGMVLELAPKRSLKKILNQYKDVHAKIHVRAMQRTFLQIASAIHYLHEKSIIYRDLKTDNILVWTFPEPRDPIPIQLGSNLGVDTVLVKLSDYGISQYVAKQGALGYVGTPGFIAPEILKYHGKEAYNQQVDVFSFGMVLYEMLTLHIPYESMAGQQANQANEQGKRPPLCRADFPCPVLARELMVWCWQQKPENRPDAPTIMEVASTEQFPRLLDGIRICNYGKVTAACSRTVSAYTRRRESQTLSPPSFSNSRTSGSQDNFSLPHLEVVSEERGSEVLVPMLDGWSSSHGVVVWNEGTGEAAPRLSGDHGKRGSTGRGSNGRGSGRGSDSGVVSYSRRESELTSSLTSSLTSRVPPSPSSPSHLLQRQMSADDLSIKRASPFNLSEEGEGPMWEVWVASSNAHHSTLSVIDYTQSFSNVEDIELGDSPVLCVSVVGKRVWLGLEAGVLVVYDANSRKPYLQSIVKHCKSIQSMLHLAPLHRVYLGLEEGSVLAFSDDLPAPPLISVDPAITNPPLVNLVPLAQYRDSTQMSACFLTLPTTRSQATDKNGKGSTSSETEAKRQDHSSGKGLYELWVGQKENRITVLDASSLTVVKFLDNQLDRSKVPSYVDYLNCKHLVCSMWESERGLVSETGGSGFVSVYSALYHGQYVTRWNARTKEPIHCFNCQPHLQQDPGHKKTWDGNITSLLFSKLELTIGLSTGLILILDPFSFNLLCVLSCHRQQVSCLLTLQMNSAHQHHTHLSSSRETMDSQGPIGNLPRSASVGSVRMSSSTGCSDKLLSFGTGFKSYYDEEEEKSKQKHEAGVLLVWESDHWRSCPSPSPNANPIPRLIV